MTNEATSTALLSDKTYNWLKKIVQLILPAFGTLYFSLAGTWNLPAANQVVATTVALATFGGVLLQVSSKTYTSPKERFDGDVIISENSEDRATFVLAFNGDPNDIPDLDALRFRVVHQEGQE